MRGSAAANLSAIRRGCNNLKKAKDAVIESGMKQMLNAALDFLHDAHDMFRDNLHHENESNTLGWALIHNGQVVMAVSQNKGPITPHGDVLAKLNAIAAGKSGWSGVVMSDMENKWYRADWEEGFLDYSRELTAQTFMEYFKAI